MKILLLGHKKFSHFQMGIVYIRKSFKAGQCLAKHCASRGFPAPGNSWVSPAPELQCTYKWQNSELHHLSPCTYTHCYWETACFADCTAQKLGGCGGQAGQVRSLADPYVVSALKLQRGTETLNETLKVGAVHPRMEIYGASLWGTAPTSASFGSNCSFLLKPLNNYQMTSFTV